MQLVLDTHGLVVKVRNRRFHIRMRANPNVGEDEQARHRYISPENISSIAVTADCMMSTAAIRLAVENHIPIYILDASGDVEGKLWSPHFVGLASLRRAQALWHETVRPLHWAQKLVEDKLSRQVTVLSTISQDQVLIDSLSLDSADAPVKENADAFRTWLFAQEAGVARKYWQTISDQLPFEWQFKGRSRRPAADPFNAALNYLYGMLYGVVEAGIFAAGLDPYMGLLHAEEYDRPALAFDLIEPFRPWLDLLLIELCTSGALNPNTFELKDGGWWAGKSARSVLIPAFNDFLEHEKQVGDITNEVRNHIYTLAGHLADDIKSWYEQEKSE